MTEPSALSQILAWSAFLLVCALLAVGILAYRANVARSAVETPQSSAGRCSTLCSVLAADGSGLPCDEPATVNIHAGHDWYPMCEGHGLPFLTEELRA